MKKIKSGILHIISLLWQDLINLIHEFDRIEPDEPYAQEAKALKKDGIVLFPDFLSPEKCDVLRGALEKLVETYPTSVHLDNGTYINHRKESNQFGADHGMIDVFEAQNSIKEIGDIENIGMIEKLLGLTSQQRVVPIRINAYINKGVSGTRCYHVDNTQPVIYKAFIYLTDVKTEAYGPYSFIKGSHKLCVKAYQNLLVNLFKKKNHVTDMKSYPDKNTLHATAPKGTLIVSHQNGMHRGMPQEGDKSRVALVFSYLIVSRLSYIHPSLKKLPAYRERVA